MRTPCNVIKDLLPLYHDGVSSEESNSIIEEHLKECEECKNELEMIDSDFRAESADFPDEEALGAAALAWKKSRKKAFNKGLIIALSAIILICGCYLGHHWFSNADSNDWADMAKHASEYFGEGYEDLGFVWKDLAGDYVAVMYTYGDNQWCTCVFERDKVFRSRVHCIGGTTNMEPGKVAVWAIGQNGDAIFALSGAELPKEAVYYKFKSGDAIFTCPFVTSSLVLDVLIIPNSYDLYSEPILLDANKKPLPGYQDIY